MDVARKISECILSIVKWIVIILGIIAISAIVIRFISSRTILKSTEGNMLSAVKTYILDGKKQKVLIEGKYNSKPILIAINDGPVKSTPFGIAYRSNYEKLLGNFIFVQWDQYGSGKNQGEVQSVYEYIPMLDDLISHLKEEFNQEVYLLSYSYGTIISGLYANTHPEKIAGIVSVNTFISNNYYINANYNELQSLELKEEDKNILEEIKDKTDNESVDTINRLGNEYIQNFQAKRQDTNILQRSYIRTLVSPDYNVIDIFNSLIYKNSKNYKRLYAELETIDMLPIYENIKVPTLFLQGDKDNSLTHDTMKSLKTKNTNIKYQALKNCGHNISDGNWENIYKLTVNHAFGNV